MLNASIVGGTHVPNLADEMNNVSNGLPPPLAPVFPLFELPELLEVDVPEDVLEAAVELGLELELAD
jgi:hypothetical protein